MRKRQHYPGGREVKKEPVIKYETDEAPDFIGNAPNYDKFKGWTPEKVLCWLNID